MQNTDQPQDVDLNDLAPVIPRPWIEPGVYPARCIGHGIRQTPYGPKLVFDYAVERSIGTNDTVVLPRYYNFGRDAAGRFKFPNGCDFRKDWFRANGGRVGRNWNSLPASVFRNQRMLVRVVNVEKDTEGPLPPPLVHSRIDRIVRPVWPGETFTRWPLEDSEIVRQIDEILGEGKR